MKRFVNFKTLALFALLFVVSGGVTYFAHNYHTPLIVPKSHYQIARPVETVSEELPFAVFVMSYNNSDYAEKNLSSIFAQKYDNYRVIYVDDASTDDTYDKVLSLIKGHEKRVTLIRNPENIGAAGNVWHALKGCEDHEIVVVVDGDDALAHPYVLERLNHYYANKDVWATYSNHIEEPDHRQGICSQPLLKSTLKNGVLRKLPWHTSHLRSAYAGLFKRIKLDDLIYNGSFLPACYDLASVYPIAEMAGDHFYYIPETLYLYNTGNPLCDSRVRTKTQNDCDRYLRKRPTYDPLPALTPISESTQCDMIAFSFNRPLQLYALLESTTQYMKGLNTIHVIYRANRQDYDEGYNEVFKAFPNVHAIKQPDHFAAPSFKPLLMTTLTKSASPYVIFAVDDLIVKDHVDLATCIDAMERTSAWGFYLKLGENTSHCYMANSHQGIPPMLSLRNEIMAWQFNKGKHDWAYANTVDMTVYRTSDVISDLRRLRFHHPAKLETKWDEKRPTDRIGLCFSRSKCVNIPLNVVSHFHNNRHMHSWTPEELMTKFNDGLKLEIDPLYQINNLSAHIDYEPTFTHRDSD